MSSNLLKTLVEQGSFKAQIYFCLKSTIKQLKKKKHVRGWEAQLSQWNDLCLLCKLWCFSGIKRCTIKSANKDEQKNVILLSGSFWVQSCKVPSIDFGQCASDWEQATSSKARWENEMDIESSDSAFPIFGFGFRLWDSSGKSSGPWLFVSCAAFSQRKIGSNFLFSVTGLQGGHANNWISSQKLHLHIYCSFLPWNFPEIEIIWLELSLRASTIVQ